VFERAVIKDLLEWKNKSNRKPLILRGASQVGKTTAIEMFSKHFDNRIFLNMEEVAHRELFNEKLSFDERISAVLLSGSVPKNSRNTLVFIDEIQMSPQAISTLRYFRESAPHIFVVAAGSLLETAIDMKASFPVGRVEYLMMHPCTFREFISALGETEMRSLLDEIPLPAFAHQKALELFKRYMLIGGMPEAVATYSITEDIVQVNSVYESLLTSFMDDVEKYSKESFVRVVRHLIKSAFSEIGNRIKFQGFGKSTYTSKEIHEAFELLQKAMLMQLIYPASSVKIPIVSDYKKSPKLLLLDSGLLHYQSGIQKEIFISQNPEAVAYGRLIEHIAGQMIYSSFSNPSASINFWAREKKQSNAEVDYIYQYRDRIIPIEVKSGPSGRLRSLHQFVDMTDHNFAVRLGDSPVSIENAVTIKGKHYRLLNLPWYLAQEIENYLKWFVVS
jgi:uncharacterized protein